MKFSARRNRNFHHLLYTLDNLVRVLFRSSAHFQNYILRQLVRLSKMVRYYKFLGGRKTWFGFMKHSLHFESKRFFPIESIERICFDFN